MNILDKIEFLLEKYVTSTTDKLYTGKTQYIEFFVDPTSNELKDVLKSSISLRGLIDVDKKHIYVWDTKYFHAKAIYMLRKEISDDKSLIPFTARIVGKKIKITEIIMPGFFVEKDIKNLKNKDFKWTKKWFVNDVGETINKISYESGCWFYDERQ
ncbi:MAG: hypothetical protein ACOC56_00890 [Atribacterota bacterium]